MSGPDETHRPAEQDTVASLIDAAGPRRQPSPAAADRVRQAVHREWRRGVRGRRIRRGIVLAMGVAVTAAAAIVGVTVVVRQDRTPPLPSATSSPRMVAATLEAVVGPDTRLFDPVSQKWAVLAVPGTVSEGSVVETAPGTRGAFRMAGGALLRVAGSTRLALQSGSAVALERGVIYIDNPGGDRTRQPVTVDTPVGRVTDVGTQFEVRLDASGLLVRVREGAVAVARPERADTATAGQELSVAPTGSLVRRRIPTSGEDWAWTLGVAPPMAIEGARLDAFLTWAAREMGWRLRYADDAVARESAGTILHGSLDALTPDQAVASVLATCNLSYRVQDGTLTVANPDRKGQ